MTGFTFQNLKPQDSLSNELRSVIRDNVLQFYAKGLSTEAEEEGPTALYERLSQEDKLDGESNSIANQELLCRGWFLPPNTYDCGSFVVNGTAVVGKEPKKPYNRCKSTQKGANSYEISI